MHKRTKVVSPQAASIWLLVTVNVVVLVALAMCGLLIYPLLQDSRKEWARRPEVVTLHILNKSKRGYLYGRVEPVVDWLRIPQPQFGCLPGQIAEVPIHVDKAKRKLGLFSLRTELFEIVLE